MFGLGRRRQQQQTIAIVGAVLGPIYKAHFNREPPVNLARVIVEHSFNPGALQFGGRTLGTWGTSVLAADALQAGYSQLDIAEQAKSACAEALGLLLRRAFAPSNVGSISAHDLGYLGLMASRLRTDEAWKGALARVPNSQSAAMFEPQVS